MKITEIDPMREEELMRRHQLSRLCARVLAAHDLPQEDLDALFSRPSSVIHLLHKAWKKSLRVSELPRRARKR